MRSTNAVRCEDIHIVNTTASFIISCVVIIMQIVKAQGFQGSVREYTNYLLAQPDKTFPTSVSI